MNFPLAERVLDADRRHVARAEVALVIRMLRREGDAGTALLLNLSADGFMAESEVRLMEHEPVRVELPLIGWLRARAVWVLGDRAGFRLRDRIEPAAYADFVRLFGQPERSITIPESRSKR